MPPRTPKRAEEPKYGGDQTRPQASTPVMPLANPLDKAYLCGKCCPALKDPLINRKGDPMYQRTVSLPRYLERVTAMRLKTQQMMQSADPDAMSRAAAQ